MSSVLAEPVDARTLPPPPAAVTEYFRRRRHTLSGFSLEDILHNERVWHVEICGLSEETFNPGPIVMRERRCNWMTRLPISASSGRTDSCPVQALSRRIREPGAAPVFRMLEVQQRHPGSMLRGVRRVIAPSRAEEPPILLGRLSAESPAQGTQRYGFCHANSGGSTSDTRTLN